MAQFLYYLPSTRAADVAQGGVLLPAALERFGLRETLGDVVRAERDASLFELAGRGPDGAGGLILVPRATSGDLPRRLGFYPAEQRWERWEPQRPDQSPVWVGVEHGPPPGPADLQRTETIAGHEVLLADGQRWTVPIYRRPYQGAEFGELPRAVRWSPDQRLQVVTKPEYQRLWDRGGQIWDVCLSNQVGDDQIAEWSLEALAVNYRLGRPEISILGLLDSTNWRQVLEATVDVPLIRQVWEEQQKKTAEPPPPE